MSIEFTPLSTAHFPLLLDWLKKPHVHQWYDQETNWDMEQIKAKYSSYTKGFKQVSGISKNIYAFIILYEGEEIGYVQYYNAYDFPREGYELVNFPESLAAIDIFIGKENRLNKGLGTQAIALFLEQHVFKQFENCLVDPNFKNKAAIRAYEKAGFRKLEMNYETEVILMVISKIMPPWAKYPEYPPMDCFWRQSGEYYLHYAWQPYWDCLTLKQQYMLLQLYPMPEEWILAEQMDNWLKNEDVLLSLSPNEEALLLKVMNYFKNNFSDNDMSVLIGIGKKSLEDTIHNYATEKDFFDTYRAVKNCLEAILENDFLYDFKKTEIENIYKKITSEDYHTTEIDKK